MSTLLATTPDTIIVERCTSESDIEDWAAAYNLVWPESPTTVSRLRHIDGARPNHHLSIRLVGRRDGEPVAYASAANIEHIYDPHRFSVSLGVAPNARGCLYGAMAWNELSRRLAPHSPHHLMTKTLETDAVTCGFLERRGFTIRERFARSRLSVPSVDGGLIDRGLARLEAEGVTVRPLSALRVEDHDGWRHDLWRLTYAIECSLPSVHEIKGMSFESFQARILDDVALSNEETYVAIAADGAMIGLSSVWQHPQNPARRYTGLTGVLSHWQRRGVATGLKLAVIRALQDSDVEVIETENLESNPMLDINIALGFVREPTELGYEADLV